MIEFLKKVRVIFSSILYLVMAVLIGGVFFLIGQSVYNSYKEKIYFDNQTRFDLAVFKDGENWFTIPSGKTELKKEFLSKKTLIEIRNGDQILESHEIKTQTGNTYVYNILNKSIYYIGQVTYASNDLQFALKSEQKNERRIEGVFFELFEVEYVFDAPPSEITVNSNGSSQSARKKYIRRVLRY